MGDWLMLFREIYWPWAPVVAIVAVRHTSDSVLIKCLDKKHAGCCGLCLGPDPMQPKHWRMKEEQNHNKTLSVSQTSLPVHYVVDFGPSLGRNQRV